MKTLARSKSLTPIMVLVAVVANLATAFFFSRSLLMSAFQVILPAMITFANVMVRIECRKKERKMTLEDDAAFMSAGLLLLGGMGLAALIFDETVRTAVFFLQAVLNLGVGMATMRIYNLRHPETEEELAQKAIQNDTDATVLTARIIGRSALRFCDVVCATVGENSYADTDEVIRQLLSSFRVVIVLTRQGDEKMTIVAHDFVSTELNLVRKLEVADGRPDRVELYGEYPDSMRLIKERLKIQQRS